MLDRKKRAENGRAKERATFGIPDFATTGGVHTFFTRFDKAFPKDFARLFPTLHKNLLDAKWLEQHNAPSMSLDRYVALPHVMVSPSGHGPGLVDGLLAARGLARHVAVRVPHFYAAIAIVARSDLVLTAPAGLAQLAPPEVIALGPPPPLPRHAIDLVGHERFAAEPAHAWLRGLVAEDARR